MDERYSIKVSDEVVEIYGDLSIEEAFDFINFFDKKGFKSLKGDHDNYTLSMRRSSIEQMEIKAQTIEHIENEKFYEKLYDESQERTKKLEKDILTLERLIKELMTDEKIKQERLRRENDSLIRFQRIVDLSQDPVAIKAMEKFNDSTE